MGFWVVEGTWVRVMTLVLLLLPLMGALSETQMESLSISLRLYALYVLVITTKVKQCRREAKFVEEKKTNIHSFVVLRKQRHFFFFKNNNSTELKRDEEVVREEERDEPRFWFEQATVA